MVSGQAQVFRYGSGSRWNITCTVQKLGYCQARATKYIERPPHAHWDIQILQPVLAPIRAGHQTLELYIALEASTRDNISRVVYVTNAEPMEYIGPKATVKVK